MSAESGTLSPSVLRPVAPQERIETVDILRGFALLCILIVNWTVNTLWDTGPWAGWTAAADRYVWWASTFLLDEKSWPMFAFLFGLGLAIQMERAAAGGRPFVRLYVRRLAALAAIGAAHYILTERTILYQWAFAGLVLLPFRTLPLKLLLALAIACSVTDGVRSAITYREADLRWNSTHTDVSLDSAILRPYVGAYVFERHGPFLVTLEHNALVGRGYNGAPFHLFPASSTEFFGRSRHWQLVFAKDTTGTVTGLVLDPGNGIGDSATKSVIDPFVADDAALRRLSVQRPTDRIYASGAFAQIVSVRARKFWSEMLSWEYFRNRLLHPWMFPPFLLGLYAGRRRIFRNPSSHRALLRKVLWCSLGFVIADQTYKYLIGPGGAFTSDPLPFAMLAPALVGENIGELVQAMGYIAGLALLLEQHSWQRRLAPFAPVGRMAFTNYLLQSVAFVLLFFGYGLGWYGKVGAFGGLMLALPVFVLQVGASRWWLRRFRFGPVEWLWRTLTYWKLQPMRIGGP